MVVSRHQEDVRKQDAERSDRPQSLEHREVRITWWRSSYIWDLPRLQRSSRSG